MRQDTVVPRSSGRSKMRQDRIKPNPRCAHVLPAILALFLAPSMTVAQDPSGRTSSGGRDKTTVDAMINMGFWDPMSCHFVKRGMAPPGISSWTRMRLNWIDPEKIKVVRPGQRTEVVLGPLEDGSSTTLVVKIPVSETTYYLVENRQPIGCDRSLPGSGVLIMYADDRIAECRQGWAPVRLMNADPSVPHLEGAAFDTEMKGMFRDQWNGISIQLEEKTGSSYRILISRH